MNRKKIGRKLIKIKNKKNSIGFIISFTKKEESIGQNNKKFLSIIKDLKVN